jgi:DMSO/TMAO reductase YedYZ molybdopterin-dependent catalytic subunit
MAHDVHPVLAPPSRPLSKGDFAREEVRLANRNSGLLLEALRHDVTPAGLHYLLIHFDVPYVPGEAWTLAVGGAVERPFSIDLAEIRRLPARTLRVTLECAGNGRGLLSPRRLSQPWHHEAVGTAEWTGTPLRHLLERARLATGTRDVVFFGADRGFDAGVEHDYGRSLAPAMALEDDVLVVWAMNGAPLLPQHGYPLRLIVPGWYGMASVKWLDRIEVWDRPFDGFQQVGTYIYKRDGDDRGEPVTTIRVKSLMVPPGLADWYTRRRIVERGAVPIHGRAWSGAGRPVARVEVAVDGRWAPAELAPAAGGERRYAWQAWSYLWQAEAGEHELACRAVDADGDTQPLEPRWDSGGFGNNAVQRVPVTVR